MQPAYLSQIDLSVLQAIYIPTAWASLLPWKHLLDIKGQHFLCAIDFLWVTVIVSQYDALLPLDFCNLKQPRSRTSLQSFTWRLIFLLTSFCLWGMHVFQQQSGIHYIKNSPTFSVHQAHCYICNSW